MSHPADLAAPAPGAPAHGFCHRASELRRQHPGRWPDRAGRIFLGDILAPFGLLFAVGLGAAALVAGGDLLSTPAVPEVSSATPGVVSGSGGLREPIFDLSVGFAADEAYYRTFSGTVRYCNLKTGAYSDWETDNSITSLTYEPNGRLLLGRLDGSVEFHWLKGIEPESTVRPQHAGGVVASAISASGRRAATGASDGSLVVWDFETAEAIHQLSSSNGPVDLVEFSPDERWLLSTGIDGEVRIWDLRSGKLQTTFAGHHARISAAEFAPNGKLVFTTSLDGTLRCWNAKSGKSVWVSEAQTSGLLAIDISPDGRRLATGGLDGKIRIWSARQPKVLTEFNAHGIGVATVALSPNAKALISSGYDGTIRRWDLETLSEIACLSPGAT